jgi:hypothetical protein
MEEQKWAIPKAGETVRFPDTKAILPVKGAWVPWIGPNGRYWRRRQIDGSITIHDEQPVEASTEKSKKVVHQKEEVTSDDSI